MRKCKYAPTPLSATDPLSLVVVNPLGQEDSAKYCSIVGTLQYFTLTRLDLAFSVNKVRQYFRAATTVHWTVKRILRYVKDTINTGTTSQPSNFTLLSAFSDTDWASCFYDRHFIGGFAIFVGRNLNF
jgi:hypothetical protein